MKKQDDNEIPEKSQNNEQKNIKNNSLEESFYYSDDSSIGESSSISDDSTIFPELDEENISPSFNSKTDESETLSFPDESITGLPSDEESAEIESYKGNYSASDTIENSDNRTRHDNSEKVIEIDYGNLGKMIITELDDFSTPNNQAKKPKNKSTNVSNTSSSKSSLSRRKGPKP